MDCIVHEASKSQTRLSDLHFHFQVVLVTENLPARVGDVRREFDPWSSPRGGQGNPLQYSCLGNPMDRRAWKATIHRVAKSLTQPKQSSIFPCMHTNCNSYKLWPSGGPRRLSKQSELLSHLSPNSPTSVSWIRTTRRFLRRKTSTGEKVFERQ